MPPEKRYIVRHKEVEVTVHHVWAQDEADAITLVRHDYGELREQEYEPLPEGEDEWEVEEASVE